VRSPTASPIRKLTSRLQIYTRYCKSEAIGHAYLGKPMLSVPQCLSGNMTHSIPRTFKSLGAKVLCLSPNEFHFNLSTPQGHLNSARSHQTHHKALRCNALKVSHRSQPSTKRLKWLGIVTIIGPLDLVGNH